MATSSGNHKPQAVLGLNAWHGDASATLLVDGEVVCAAEEERFRRIKHWAGFPSQSIDWCLREAGMKPKDVRYVAVNRDPSAQRFAKLNYVLRNQLSWRFLKDRLANQRRFGGLQSEWEQAFGQPLSAKIFRIEHHRAHLASAFFVSPFEQAAVVSVDGFGDFGSAAFGIGRRNELQIQHRVRFPHSLGQLYLAVTQYLGFPKYGDEYKVMGLAAYGKPTYLDRMRKLVRNTDEGGFELDLTYFLHHRGKVGMTWEGGEPVVERSFSHRMEELLGPARDPQQEEIGERHTDLAASLQALYEEVFFGLLCRISERTGERRLALAGGCAMNGLANGKILEQTPFQELYVPPAPGDAGGSMGAALSAWCERLGGQRPSNLDHAYLGPQFEEPQIDHLLNEAAERLEEAGCRRVKFEDPDERCEQAAERLAQGRVIGWFQNRMEWGPRALGNRSILADPRRRDMRELLNGKIKLRESFRPFAPSILEEQAGAWFEQAESVPFMLQIHKVRSERREEVPAVTHVDGTGRLQTVSSQTNPLYHRLIEAFDKRTGVPMVLNTSFNENEPVVCRPEEALDCFLRTRMDALVLGPWLIERAA